MGLKDIVGKLFHLCFATYYLYSYYFYCIFTYPGVVNSSSRPEAYRYGGDSKFLTMWCLGFQIFYFILCCLTDLVLVTSDPRPRGSKAKLLTGIRDWFLCSIAFPAALVVVMMFWSLWSIDRELVFPKALDEFFPMWLNHVMHTYLLPILLVEIWLVKHQNPSRRLGLTTLFLASALYAFWLMWLGFAKDIWVYPILRVLSGAKFGLFVVATAVVPLPIYFIGEWCIAHIHGPVLKEGKGLEKRA